MNQEENLKILIAEKQSDYELIDSGDGEKLERFGSITIRRPDPQVLWPKSQSTKVWLSADAEFSKESGAKTWLKKKNVPEKWDIVFGGINFGIKLTPFKHTGLFPEQISQWDFMRTAISDALTENDKREISVLNLFAYTGGATIACAQEGAHVTHVDASRGTIDWAQKNTEASGIKKEQLRFILEDALIFAKKELKRGKKYDAIIMDPPAFGRGAKGEIWKIEEKFGELLDVTAGLLSDTPLFVVLNGYSAGYSAIGYKNALIEALAKRGITTGTFEAGELAIKEAVSGRLLPAGIFARWSI